MLLLGFFANLFKRRDTKKAAAEPSGKTQRVISSFLPRWLRGDYTIANSEIIFSAVSRISNALASMPMRHYVGHTPRPDDLDDLVSFEPNPTMTAFVFFQTMEACRLTYGNAYALKVPSIERSEPYLYILDPDRVKPIVEKDSRELWYRITPEEGNAYYIHSFHVIHVPFISTNGYHGVSPIQVLFNTLKYQSDIEEFSSKQLEKGVNAQVVLEAPANLGQAQREKAIEDFQETYKNTGGNILLLESGIQAKSLTLSAIDAKVFECEKVSRSRVAMVYNIPPHMLGDFTETSYTSQEQQTLEFLSLTMTPIVTLYEQAFAKSMIPRVDRKAGGKFQMEITALLRSDMATMADVHQKAVRGGWKTINEARRYDGSPDIEGGDETLVAKDLVPLKLVLAQTSTQKTT